MFYSEIKQRLDIVLILGKYSYSCISHAVVPAFSMSFDFSSLIMLVFATLLVMAATPTSFI